jgi:hypothetical protein
MALYFINEPACSADVFEVEEDTFARCSVSRARALFYTATAIFIIIIIVLIAIGAWSGLILTVLVGGLILILAGANAFWYANWSARRAHRAVQYEIGQTIYSHNGDISRGEAINIIRQERIAREQAASRIDAAHIQARATSQGFGNLASAWRRK